MLFTSSFKLLSVAAFVLPALLVGARYAVFSSYPLVLILPCSPYSLNTRAGAGEIRHLKLIGYVGSDTTNTMREFEEVTLRAITDEKDKFIVRGGWQGTPAQAQATTLAGVYTDWINDGVRNGSV